MKLPAKANFWGVLGLVLILGGCGVSGSTTTASGGTGGTGISAGSVTGFGSIFVNGVEFETDSAAFTVDGQSGAAQNDLAIGMVVTVKGAIAGSSGTATTVNYRDVIEGQVEQKVNANTLIVMGQTVEVDDKTKFGNVAGIDAVDLGNILEVSGFVKGPGLVAATYIERKTALPIDYEVHGFVSGHDALAKTFMIGSLTVNYAGASELKDLPNGGSWDGLLVAVTGDAYDSGSKTITAVKVESETDPTQGATEAEVEGYVTALLGANRFLIGKFAVEISGTTQFENGTTADLVLGAYLEVEGSVANGVIYAREVEFKNKIRVEANVASVDAGAGTLTFFGLNGMTVTVNALTDYNNASSLADVAVGNYVRVTGRPTAAPGTVVATLVDWEASAPTLDPKLLGPLSVDPVDPFVTILGVLIDTSGWPDSAFKGVAGGRSAFFANAQANDIVQLAGKGVGSTVTWESIELK